MPLDPQVQAMMAQVAKLNLPPVNKVSPAEARANGRKRKQALGFEVEPVADVKDSVISGPECELKVRIYRPAGEGPHPLIMLFHGGGWVVGDLDGEDTTGRGLCNRANAVVVSVDYRLAPETRFPGAVDDCYAATVWAADHAEQLGIDPTRIAVAGTSAGGNLSAAVAIKARDKGGPEIAHQVLFVPVTDCDFETRSYVELGEGYGLTRDAMRWYWDHYIGPDGDPEHPYASVLRAHLRGVAPATIITAEFDPLRDEGERFAKALEKAGVSVKLTCYSGMTHGFNNQVGVIDKATDALDEAASHLRAAFSK